MSALSNSTSLAASLFASYIIDASGTLHACGRLPFGTDGGKRNFITLTNSIRHIAAGEDFVLLQSREGRNRSFIIAGIPLRDGQPELIDSCYRIYLNQLFGELFCIIPTTEHAQ